MNKQRFSVAIDPEGHKFVGFNIPEAAETFGLQTARPVSFPMQPGLDLEANNGSKLPDARLNQALLGALLHINLQTRPDLCYSVKVLSRHLKDPTTTHPRLLNHVVRYLKSFSALGLR